MYPGEEDQRRGDVVADRNVIRAVSYARVSSDRQEQEETIQSQLAELRFRAKEDSILNCLEFTDEGYSRDTLARPSLDRLRDSVARGELDNRVGQVAYCHLAHR